MDINHLSKINKHLNDNDVSLEESTHIYNIQGDTTFISTTTFIHGLFEQFDSDKIIDNMMRSKNWIKNNKRNRWL